MMEAGMVVVEKEEVARVAAETEAVAWVGEASVVAVG